MSLAVRQKRADAEDGENTAPALLVFRLAFGANHDTLRWSRLHSSGEHPPVASCGRTGEMYSRLKAAIDLVARPN